MSIESVPFLYGSKLYKPSNEKRLKDKTMVGIFDQLSIILSDK